MTLAGVGQQTLTETPKETSQTICYEQTAAYCFKSCSRCESACTQCPVRGGAIKPTNNHNDQTNLQNWSTPRTRHVEEKPILSSVKCSLFHSVCLVKWVSPPPWWHITDQHFYTTLSFFVLWSRAGFIGPQSNDPLCRNAHQHIEARSDRNTLQRSEFTRLSDHRVPPPPKKRAFLGVYLNVEVTKLSNELMHLIHCCLVSALSPSIDCLPFYKNNICRCHTLDECLNKKKITKWVESLLADPPSSVSYNSRKASGRSSSKASQRSALGGAAEGGSAAGLLALALLVSSRWGFWGKKERDGGLDVAIRKRNALNVGIKLHFIFFFVLEALSMQCNVMQSKQCNVM